MSSLANKRILIAEDDPMQARLLQQTLVKAGATVEVLGDGKSARDRLRRGGVDAFITDWMMPALDGIELARELRAASNRPVVVLVSALSLPGAKAHALEAGADEFMPKPLTASAVVETLARCLARRTQGPAHQPAVPDVVHDHPVAQTATWRRASQILRDVTAEFVTVPLRLVTAGAPLDDSAVRKVLPLLDPEHAMELHVVAEMTRPSAAELARTLLGDGPTDEETAADLVGEVANIASGALKTAFSAEAFPFTLGLATRLDVPHATDFSISDCIALEGESFSLRFELGVRPRNAVEISAPKLREGMVLADNLRSSGGALILPIGTRLTGTAVERLRNLLGSRIVRVCVPEIRTGA